MKFRESKLAHEFLDGLYGLEIGGSAHNSFGLATLNVDFNDDMSTIYKQSEVELCGEALPVDVVAYGDDLPFEDEFAQFVVSSHVIEHFYDPIKAVNEWLRVTEPGGYIFIIAPHKERTCDAPRPRTTLLELIERHRNPDPEVACSDYHHSVWITEDFLELCNYCGWKVVAYQDVDDKVGNGFTVVIQKP